MIAGGYAHEYTYNLPYTLQKNFQEAESDAQEKKLGLWGDACGCKKGTKIGSSCTNQCNKAEVTLKNWDCSTYTQIRQDNSCKEGCQSQAPLSPQYTCNCSKTCSQLSCEEAYFQLNNCGCSRRDGDSDGIPCESIC